MYSFTGARCGVGPGVGGQTVRHRGPRLQRSIPKGYWGNLLQEAQEKADFGQSESETLFVGPASSNVIPN